MQNAKRSMAFLIDGYEVSATFADKENPVALGQIKQILLSSFSNNISTERHGDILAISSKRRDNIDGERNRVP